MHKTYGEGTIINLDDSYIIVQFDSVAEPKRFAYPSCFDSFLKLLGSENDKREQQVRQTTCKLDPEILPQTNCFPNSNQSLGQIVLVNKFCDTFTEALSNEVKYLQTVGAKHQRIFDGRRIDSQTIPYLYTFRSEDELYLPNGTQITLWLRDGNFDSPGLVIHCEKYELMLQSDLDLGDKVPSLEISAEPWELLEALQERLGDLRKMKSVIATSLICNGRKAIDHGNYKIKIGQETAVRLSKIQPITFVWGPPGTGKTQTLASIALEHINMGHRVLMLSHSNVSVDGAILRVHKLAPNLAPGTLLRYGYPRQKELLDHEYLTSYKAALLKHPNLMLERKNLMEEQSNLSRSSQRYGEISVRLSEIRKKILAAEKQLVMSAKFVATTISKTVVDGALHRIPFDVVLFDEASMAYIPQIAYAASLAKKHFVCLGDFRQLPPIVQSGDTSPLNDDIFDYCGITAAVDSGTNHTWLCMLNTQYRMHPYIADFVSQTMYNNLLHSAPVMMQNRQDIAQLTPAPGHAMAFADLTEFMNVCIKTDDQSRLNILIALLSFALAIESAKTHKVGIITPYRAQSRLLHAMSQDVADDTSSSSLKPISGATVHQFQGSEMDVIIYDAVDCYRMTCPSKLLTSTTNNLANRLFNVALTRAKGKFVCVANISYFENKNLSRNLIFRRLIKTQKQKSSCVNGQQLLSSISLLPDKIMQFFNETDGSRHFVSDILAAEQEIMLDIPAGITDNAFINHLISALLDAKRKGVKVHIRAESKGTLPPALQSIAVGNSFVINPVVIIDKEIVWFGMPASESAFRVGTHIIPTKYRPIIRFTGKHTAALLFELLKMNKTTELNKTGSLPKGNKCNGSETFMGYVPSAHKCPICGKPMLIKKNSSNQFFLGCSGYPNCRNTEAISLYLINAYLNEGKYCVQCHGALEAKASSVGPYVQCRNNILHKYKLDEV